MDQLFGILVVLVMGAILSIPIYYLMHIQQKREDEKNIALGKVEAKRLQEIKENQEKGLVKLLLRPSFPIEKSMEITGPESFKQAVYKVLAELRSKAPERYIEAVRLLPKAEYVTGDRGFSGRSDGLFTIDGSNYDHFRRVFLHEVGHNVAYKENNDHSEEAANRYANMVQRELGL